MAAESIYALTLREKAFRKDRDGKVRFADPALEILRRSLGVDPNDDIPAMFTMSGEQLLNSLPKEMFKERMKLLGFQVEGAKNASELIHMFIEKSSRELDVIKKSDKKERIARKELEISRNISILISGIPYEHGVDTTVAITDRRALNCVGAERLGSLIMNKIGLTYLFAEAPGHSLNMQVILSNNTVYMQDLRQPDLNVRMTDESMDGATVYDITQLVISDMKDGVVTFEIKTPELDEMKSQLINRKGKQFTCRVYSSEIGYALQLLYNLSIKFHKPEWVLTFSRIGLEFSSKHVPLLLRYGNATEILKGLSAAEEHYTKALDLESGIAVNHARMGRVRVQQGRYDEALAYYEQAHAITPEDGTILSRIAEIYEGTGQHNTAETYYRRAIRTDEKYSWPQIGLIKLLLRAGKMDEARKIARRCLKISYYSAAMSSSVSAFFETSFPDMAEAMYAKSAQKWPNEKMLTIQHGEFFARQGRIDEARGVFENVLKNHPDDPGGYLAYGRMLKKAGLPDDASEVFRKVLSASHTGHDEHIRRELLGYFQDMDEFPEIYHTVIPTYETWYYKKLAEELRQSGDIDGTISCLKIALDIDPYDKDGYISIIKLYIQSNRPQEAEDAFRALSSLSESLRLSEVIGMSELLIMMGKYSDAEVFILTRILPDDSYIDFWTEISLKRLHTASAESMPDSDVPEKLRDFIQTPSMVRYERNIVARAHTASEIEDPYERFVFRCEVAKYKNTLTSGERKSIIADAEIVTAGGRDISYFARDLEQHETELAGKLYRLQMKQKPTAFSQYRLAMLKPESQRLPLLKKAASIEPLAQILEEMIRVSEVTGNPDVAFDAMITMFAHHPHLGDFQKLVTLSETVGRVSEVSAIATKLLERDSLSDDTIRRITIFYQGHADLSIPVYDLTNERLGELPDSLVGNMGVFFGYLGETEKARACFSYLVREKGNPEALVRMFTILPYREFIEFARMHADTVVETLLKRDVRQIDAFIEAIGEKGHAGFTEVMLKKIVDVKPTESRIITLARQGTRTDAISILSKGTEQFPTASMFYALGREEENQGELNDALEHFEHACTLQFSPSRLSAYLRIAAVMHARQPVINRINGFIEKYSTEIARFSYDDRQSVVGILIEMEMYTQALAVQTARMSPISLLNNRFRERLAFLYSKTGHDTEAVEQYGHLFSQVSYFLSSTICIDAMEAAVHGGNAELFHTALTRYLKNPYVSELPLLRSETPMLRGRMLSINRTALHDPRFGTDAVLLQKHLKATDPQRTDMLEKARLAIQSGDPMGALGYYAEALTFSADDTELIQYAFNELEQHGYGKQFAVSLLRVPITSSDVFISSARFIYRKYPDIARQLEEKAFEAANFSGPKPIIMYAITVRFDDPARQKELFSRALRMDPDIYDLNSIGDQYSVMNDYISAAHVEYLKAQKDTSISRLSTYLVLLSRTGNILNETLMRSASVETELKQLMEMQQWTEASNAEYIGDTLSRISNTWEFILLAGTAYGHAVDLDPTSQRFCKLAATQKPDDAVLSYEKAIGLRLTRDAIIGWTKALANSSREDNAVRFETITKSIAESKSVTDADIFNILALRAQSYGQFPLEIALLKRLKKANWDYASVDQRIGIAYFNSNNRGQAKKWLTKAFEREPNNREKIELLYPLFSNTQQELKEFAEMIMERSGYENIYFQLRYDFSGDKQMVLKLFRSLVRHNGSHVNHEQLASLLYESGDIEEALEHYRIAMTDSTNIAQTAFERVVEILVATGRSDEAKQIISNTPHDNWVNRIRTMYPKELFSGRMTDIELPA